MAQVIMLIIGLVLMMVGIYSLSVAAAMIVGGWILVFVSVTLEFGGADNE